MATKDDAQLPDLTAEMVRATSTFDEAFIIDTEGQLVNTEGQRAKMETWFHRYYIIIEMALQCTVLRTPITKKNAIKFFSFAYCAKRHMVRILGIAEKSAIES